MGTSCYENDYEVEVAIEDGYPASIGPSVKHRPSKDGDAGTKRWPQQAKICTARVIVEAQSSQGGK